MGKRRSGIDGTIGLTREIFERWSNYEKFHTDLTECCAILGIRSGLNFRIAPDRLRAAHDHWLKEQEVWKSYLLPVGTKEISHLKKAALLAIVLCENVAIVVTGKGHGEESDAPEENFQDGLERSRPPIRLELEDVRKFKDGGTHYVAWLLTYAVCEFFERHRDDKKEAFEDRITEEFEMDVVSGLLSGKISPQALHLILKALFLRD
jgi:hypothetical protein